jgi:beta-lactamase superfamily II metal-dependent hydrolase
MRWLSLLVVALAPWCATFANAADQDPKTSQAATFTLWQLPEQTRSQMMSYVIRTVSGKLIVIDGGTAGDAPYLRGFLAALGNQVEAWFISHPHSDHVDALTEILRRPQKLQIGTIYASLPDPEWIAQYVPKDDDHPNIKNFREALAATKLPYVDLQVGQTFAIDGVHIEVFAIRNPEITQNPLNNSSVVLKVWDDHKSILFLGDLGVEAGKKLLAGPYGDKLHTDYVQMAHHGQNGAGEEVYQAIKPSYCLWPTPLWLWDCDSGKGKGSGPWKTLQVRAWMDKLNIQHHYVMAEGLQRID